MNKEIEKIISPIGLNESEFKLIQGVYTDPATVIAIAETGYKIYNMFKKKKAKPNVELVYLKKIYTEIRDMQNDLNTIINLLHDLKVYIQQNQIEYISNVLSSKINTINLFLIGWLENGRGNLEEQFASIHETKFLLGNYGFAHIHIYMLAFRKELDLCYWLKKGPVFTKVLLEDSKQYFIDAINSKHQLDTPAKKLVEIINLMQILENNYPIGNFNEEVREIIKATGSNNRDGYKRSKFTLNISGDIANGYTFAFSELILEIRNPWYYERTKPEHGGGAGGGGGGHILELERKIFYQGNTPILETKIKAYNEARELYLHYLKSKLELTTIIVSINQLIEVIDTWTE